MVTILSIVGAIISFWQVFTADRIIRKVFTFLLALSFLCRSISVFDSQLLYFYGYILFLSVGLFLLIMDFIKSRSKPLGIVLLGFVGFIIGSYSALLELPYRYEIFIIRVLLIFLPAAYLFILRRKDLYSIIIISLILLLFLIEILVKYQFNWFF